MGDINIWKFTHDSDLSNYTLVIPSVAVGNVGQLACDLLISSLDMKKTGSVYSPAFIPVMGYDPYNLKSEYLSGSCDFYKSESRKLIIAQIRSPLVYKYAKQFLEELLNKFKERNIQDMIVMTSSYAHEKKHILSSPLRFLTVKSSCPYWDKIENLNWVKHEHEGADVKIFGGGYASLLYKIAEQKNCPCLIMYVYCSEGDNVPDAYNMVYYLMRIFHLFDEEKDLPSQLKQPVSWKLLFGRPPPADIY